jgi:NitT/TauT family transport system substrate-binding protein
MNKRTWLALLAAIVSFALPHVLAAETLKIASPIRGSWEGAIPELGKQAGIFQKHGLDLDILYTQGGGETLQVVVSGSVDVGLSAGVLGSLGAYAKGAPIRIIGAS